MAKSIRSKWKRKMRAVKRERYGKKELEKLKAVVSKDPLHPDRIVRDVDMAHLSEIATVVDSKSIVKDEAMDDGRKVYNTDTLLDQNGSYPNWLGSHRRRKLMRENKRAKKQKKKIVKKNKKKTNLKK